MCFGGGGAQESEADFRERVGGNIASSKKGYDVYRTDKFIMKQYGFTGGETDEQILDTIVAGQVEGGKVAETPKIPRVARLSAQQLFGRAPGRAGPALQSALSSPGFGGTLSTPRDNSGNRRKLFGA